MDVIRLMLVDDHDVVRTGLRTFLDSQEGLQVVAEARNGQEALHLAREAMPDVVVMDIAMPVMDGLEATRRMKVIYPECKILALTVHTDKQVFFGMLAAGASGYVTKQVPAAELVAAIRCVADGNVYLQPVLASWLLEDYRRMLAHMPDHELPAGDEAPLEKGLDVLSGRELQVLELVADGLDNVQVGDALEISPKTVARHRERIMNKLGIHTSTELVKFAIRTGLVNLH